MSAVREEIHRFYDLRLEGSTVRASVVPGTDGEPASLILSHGFGSGSTFTRPAWCESPIRIPASAIPELIEALTALGAP